MIAQNMKESYDLGQIKYLFHHSIKTIINKLTVDLTLNPEQLQKCEYYFVTFCRNKWILSSLLELKKWDSYSYYHSFHVFLMGALITQRMEIKDEKHFILGCLLHDIGKLHVEREILRKTGKLTLQEFESIKEHTIQGEKWLAQQKISQKEKDYIGKIIRSHHERMDGTGYPDQWSGMQISYDLRVLSIIDVFSALTLKRVYRSPFTVQKALEVMFLERDKYDEHLLQSMMVFFENVSQKMKKITYKEVVKKNEEDRNKYIQYLVNGDKINALNIFDRLSDGLRIEEIYDEVVTKALHKIGDMWSAGEITVVEEHIASSITREILDMKLSEYYREQPNKDKVLVCPMYGEEHSLPSKIIGDALMVNGWKVYSLEKYAPTDQLISFLKKEGISYIGFSVTMRSHAARIEGIVKQLKKEIPGIIVMVGGQALAYCTSKQVDIKVNSVTEAVRELEWYRSKSSKKH